MTNKSQSYNIINCNRHEKSDNHRTSDNKNRIKYWDVAKGITIVLVIMGHIKNSDPLMRKIIFSYHMPFFFIANAYFIRDYNFISNLKKGARSLLIPYAAVGIIVAILSVLITKSNSPIITFFNRIADMILGFSRTNSIFESFQGVWLMWFVICLFASKMMYIVLMHFLYSKMRMLQLLIMILLAHFGWLIGEYFAYLPWSADIALVALPFMWLGDRLQKSDIINKHKAILFVICMAVWVSGLLLNLDLELAIRKYPFLLPSLTTAAAGSIVVIYISMAIEKYFGILSNFLSWCGQNTMIILAIHNIEMRFFDSITYISSNWVFVFIAKATLIIFVSYIIVQAMKFIKKLLPDIQLKSI